MTVALVFPGQGSQRVGMGKEWLTRSETVRRTFEEADDALSQKLSSVILDGPAEALRETENTQPALLTVSVAYARVLEEAGVRPGVVAGHSLGEYSALVCANALSFADAVRLTRLRGRAMQSAVPLGVGTMAAILGISDPDVVVAICKDAAQGEVVEPAGYNTPGQVVVAGSVGAVRRACEVARERGGMGKELEVSAPFHCSLLVPAGEVLRDAVAKVEVLPLRCPYVPNVTAEWLDAPRPEVVRAHLVAQVSRPVLWEQSMRTMASHGVSRWLEVGSGRTLCGLIKRFDRKAEAQDFEAETWRT
jgi:[acyl-carrier-protein] S-malonyltransferase